MVASSICSANARIYDCYFNDTYFSCLAGTRAARARQEQASTSTSAAQLAPTAPAAQQAPTAPAAQQAPTAPAASQAAKVYVICMYFRAV